MVAADQFLVDRYLDGLATTWQTMYMQEPCKGVAAENEHLVMGGGGEQW